MTEWPIAGPIRCSRMKVRIFIRFDLIAHHLDGREIIDRLDHESRAWEYPSPVLRI